MDAKKLGEIVHVFFGVRDHLKLYHWQTTSYARHKASDKLVKKLTVQIDLFMEVIQGNKGYRIVMPNKSFITLSNQNDDCIVKLLQNFYVYLKDLETYINLDYSLRNIRDEMMADVNKTLYLFSLK